MSKPFKSFFKVVGGNEGSLCKYNTRLDTYGCGCQHDCSYCYAKSLLDFRKMWNPDSPRVASLDDIARRIKRIQPGTIVRLGGMTDCFQPIEAQHKVTKNTIMMLNRAKVGYLIVTKSHLIGTDEYLKILDPKLAHVQVSITSTDDTQALKYERCSKSSKRLEAVKRLQDAGIDVAVRLSPYIPDFIDLSVINSIQPMKILVEFMRVNHWTKKWLGNLVDLSDYTLKSGGYSHLPLDQKIKHMQNIKAETMAELSVCEDVPEHYEHWKNNFNENSADCCNLRG